MPNAAAEIVTVNLRRVRRDAVDRAARVIRRGGVILYPTDTIYGLGCDACNEKAVRKVFGIKRRAKGNAALVLVRNGEMVSELVAEIPAIAREYMRRFWPGPLTLVLRARRHLNRYITSARGTIGIRIPANSFCLKLLSEVRTPLVSTSANISGNPDTMEAAELTALFRSKVDLIIDAGPLPPSGPSTVVDVTGAEPVILREGAIPAADLLPRRR
jgi:L-threonylcarbamoyladenylate synthase